MTSRVLWLPAALCVSCAAPTPRYATSPRVDPDSPRQAPGVAEVRSAVPPTATRAGDTRDQLLFLRAPAAPELARGTVRSFLRAAVNEAQERLESLLAPEAVVDTSIGRQPARSFWHARLAQLDYGELKGQLLFRDSDLEVYRAEDLARLPRERRIALALADDEVAVRVPIRVSWAGRTRLFGDELVFRLAPLGTRFEIAEISEDFRLP